MLINPHTGEIDDQFLAEIHTSAFPTIRIQDAGDEFLIEYFFDNGGSYETGIIRVIKETFETYNHIMTDTNV